ncbi:hypothetical protein DERP_012047 [Dermatophagoides pteronyssinus]|uniref:Uncharacterized protein n=1 Tax=Dermatophagoides pteronyssinus TaxID=6956 RepID=A0ABQ8IVP7_DERPT|nr:hypothetical protein DERP_012047 [Dermatophagoides pteronyssinus]
MLTMNKSISGPLLHLQQYAIHTTTTTTITPIYTSSLNLNREEGEKKIGNLIRLITEEELKYKIR